MANRIDVIFNKLKEQNRKALIPFIANGDPSKEETINMVLDLEKNGADIIELGVPFSDPLADGPVIQESYIRALKGGIKVKDVFEVGKKVRQTIAELGGTMPEDLPTPDKGIKQIEKEEAKRLRMHNSLAERKCGETDERRD